MSTVFYEDKIRNEQLIDRVWELRPREAETSHYIDWPVAMFGAVVDIVSEERSNMQEIIEISHFKPVRSNAEMMIGH